MVFTSTLTSKNQTTIPKAVIEALNATTSATQCFEVEADGRILLTAKSASFEGLAGSFPKKSRQKPATLSEMERAIRQGAARGLHQSSPASP